MILKEIETIHYTKYMKYKHMYTHDPMCEIAEQPI